MGERQNNECLASSQALQKGELIATLRSVFDSCGEVTQDQDKQKSPRSPLTRPSIQFSQARSLRAVHSLCCGTTHVKLRQQRQLSWRPIEQNIPRVEVSANKDSMNQSFSKYMTTSVALLFRCRISKHVAISSSELSGISVAEIYR